MFKAVGNYVWGPSPDGTDSVVAVTMGNLSAESIAEGLNLLREHERREKALRDAFTRFADVIRNRELHQKERTDSLRQAMREDVAQLHKIIHGQPQEVS